MRIALLITLLALLVANIAGTVVVLRSNAATPMHKALQSLFVWLIPLLGAFVVITFHWLDRRNQGPRSEPSRLDGSEVDAALAARHDGHNV
jgi:hypothetical protein